MQVKFLLAVGADFGQRPGGKQRPARTDTVIDAVPLDVSEKRTPFGDRATLRGATPFRSRHDHDGNRAAPAAPGRLNSPQTVVIDRRARPTVSVPPRALHHGVSVIGNAAFLAPPGYDAGLRSPLPALLDVTV